ncbi:hypothetical protein D3C78_956990 [compost metagenome]
MQTCCRHCGSGHAGPASEQSAGGVSTGGQYGLLWFASTNGEGVPGIASSCWCKGSRLGNRWNNGKTSERNRRCLYRRGWRRRNILESGREVPQHGWGAARGSGSIRGLGHPDGRVHPRSEGGGAGCRANWQRWPEHRRGCRQSVGAWRRCGRVRPGAAFSGGAVGGAARCAAGAR